MESTDGVVKQENTTTAHKVAVISAVWFVLSSSADNVCAQNNANDDRMIQPTSPFVVSGNETFVTRPNPPAIFTERKIGRGRAGEAASNERIIVNPVIGRAQPASAQPVASAPLAVRAGTQP